MRKSAIGHANEDFLEYARQVLSVHQCVIIISLTCTVLRSSDPLIAKFTGMHSQMDLRKKKASQQAVYHWSTRTQNVRRLFYLTTKYYSSTVHPSRTSRSGMEMTTLTTWDSTDDDVNMHFRLFSKAFKAAYMAQEVSAEISNADERPDLVTKVLVSHSDANNKEN